MKSPKNVERSRKKCRYECMQRFSDLFIIFYSWKEIDHALSVSRNMVTVRKTLSLRDVPSNVQTSCPPHRQYTRVLVRDTGSVCTLKMSSSYSSSQKIQNQNTQNEATTNRVQKLMGCFVGSKQREHLFRNFIVDFTVLSPQDNVSNPRRIKALNKS